MIPFLEQEGLLENVESGLHAVAHELGQNPNDFAPSAMRTLARWKVRDSRAVSRFGSIQPRNRTMRITALDCSPGSRRDTILHEVAHILAQHWVGSRERHGPRWQRIAVALGARPRAMGRDERFSRAARALRLSRQKVVARCDRCGYEIRRMRRSSREWRRYRHRTCGGRFLSVDPTLV